MTGAAGEGGPASPDDEPTAGFIGSGAHRVASPPVVTNILAEGAASADPSAEEVAPPSQSLRHEVASGMAWSTGSRMFVQVLGFATSIVMARILSPREFGLMATVYVFSGLASLLSDMGIASALVQKRDLGRRDLDTAFWVSVGVGAALAGIVGGIAGPAVAAFYDEPVLEPLMWIIATTFLMTVHVVPLGMLERSMNFKKIAFMETIAYAVGAAAAVAAAVAGWGVYSLAVTPVVTGLLLALLFFGAVRYRPHSFASRQAAKELWGFTGGYTGANALAYFSSNVDALLIGRILGQVPLGYFGRSSSLVSLPSQQVGYVMSRVMLPALARIRDDGERLRGVYLRAAALLSVAVCVNLGLLAAVSGTLVPFVWGERWTPMVPIVQALCLAGCWRSMAWPISWLCQVSGRTTLMLQLGLVTFGLALVGSVIGLQFGVVGVACALAVSTLASLVPTFAVGARLLQVGAWTVVRPVLPGLLAAAAGSAAGLAAADGIGEANVLLVLLVQSVSVLVVALAVLLVADRLLGTRILTSITAFRRLGTDAS